MGASIGICPRVEKYSFISLSLSFSRYTSFFSHMVASSNLNVHSYLDDESAWKHEPFAVVVCRSAAVNAVSV